MPRKTIAALEAEIAKLEDENRFHVEDIEMLKARLEAFSRDPNTYLAYVPTGDPELDAIQVAGRAIESLPDPVARHRCAHYLRTRFARDAFDEIMRSREREESASRE